jgi:hypothetical protein
MASEQFIIAGDDAASGIDMMRDACLYLSGPGNPGFLAWLDQRYPAELCSDCGKHHGPSADAVMGNLVNLGKLLGDILSQAGYA